MIDTNQWRGLFAMLLGLILAGCPPTTEEPVEPATGAEPDTAAEPVSEATVAAPYEGDDAAFFTIDAKPWSTIWLDGTLLGNTPKKKVEIPAGEHSVLLKCGPCPEPQEKKLRFTVAAGETYTSIDNEFEE